MTVQPLDYSEFSARTLQLADRARANQRELAAAHQACADAERTYRRAQAQAWADASGTVPEREAQVASATSDERHARDIARGRIDVARRAIRNVSDERHTLVTLAAWARQAPDGHGGH